MLLSLVLAACDHQASRTDIGADIKSDGPKIECAVDGQPLTRACPVERYLDPHGGGLLVRNPSGGFHRFTIVSDGRGVATADGAEQAIVIPVNANTVDVTIGPDRYRLPATVKGR